MSSSKSGWLSSSTRGGKVEILADMIVDGDRPPFSKEKPWLLPVAGNGKAYDDGFKKFQKEKAVVLKSREELNPIRRKLYDLISERLNEDPVEAEGRIWANLQASTIASELGKSVDYVRTLYKGNPFRHCIKIIEGRKTTLLRIGHPSDLTSEDQARMMCKFWRGKTKKRETKTEFGLLKGIAEDCPTGMSYDNFRTVVSNWSQFMACVKIAQALGQYEGDQYDANNENFVRRFLAFPSISLIRRFVHVAVDFYEELL